MRLRSAWGFPPGWMWLKPLPKETSRRPPPSSNIRQVQGQRFSETNSRGRDGAQLSEGTASRCRTTAPIEAPLLPLLQVDHLPHFTAPKKETESVLKHFHPG